MENSSGWELHESIKLKNVYIKPKTDGTCANVQNYQCGTYGGWHLSKCIKVYSHAQNIIPHNSAPPFFGKAVEIYNSCTINKILWRN